MYSGMFESTSIPILEQVVQFTEARHTVLAGNIANMDTPGYKARDLSVEDFQARLGEALEACRQPLTPRPQESLEAFDFDGFVSPGEMQLPEALPGGLGGQTAGETSSARPLLAEVAKNTKSIMMHDESQVGMEQQVSEMVKNQMQHNMALNLLVKQFQVLSTAISGRV